MSVVGGCDSAQLPDDSAGVSSSSTVLNGSTTIVVEEQGRPIDPAAIEQMKQIPREELEQQEKQRYDRILELVKSISNARANAEKLNNPRLLDGIQMSEMDIASNKKMWAALRTAQGKSTTFPSEFSIK